jgi:hypothetical protein
LIIAAASAGAQIAAIPEKEVESNLLGDLVKNISWIGTRPLVIGSVGLMASTPSLSIGETNLPYRGWIDGANADRVFEYGDFLGNGGVHVAGAVSLYLAGKAFHKPNLAVFGSDLTSGLLIAGTISTGLKVLTQRTRPDGAPHSFPSGHATMAFTTAGVIANRYGVIPGIVAEAGALYVGLSRLQENKHYITDVIAGAALGNLIAYQVVTRRKQNEHLAISLEPSMRGVSTALVYRFK